MPVPTAGMINSSVVKKMVLRPPAMRMKKLFGIRKVAPVRPAMADRVNNSPLVKGKPRLSICTVMMLQYIHTVNAPAHATIEIHRLRLAIRLPSDSQNWLSSTSHCLISAITHPFASNLLFSTLRSPERNHATQASTFFLVRTTWYLRPRYQIGALQMCTSRLKGASRNSTVMPRNRCSL